jgi:ABC-type arginine transport system ATPase subunit
VRITRIAAENFLSFRALDFAEIGPGLTVVVGPNGAGKSNLTRVIELMGRALAFADFTRSVDFGRYLDARHVGSSAGSPLIIRVGVALDKPAERALIRTSCRRSSLP